MLWHGPESVQYAGIAGLRLGRDGDRLVLSVQDDGIGLPSEHPTNEGIGMRVMQYRAHMIGGAFEVRSAPGGGTLITCVLPHTEADLTPAA